MVAVVVVYCYVVEKQAKHIDLSIQSIDINISTHKCNEFVSKFLVSFFFFKTRNGNNLPPTIDTHIGKKQLKCITVQIPNKNARKPP